MGQNSSQLQSQGSSKAIEEGTVFLTPRKQHTSPSYPSQEDALSSTLVSESIPLPPDDPFDAERDQAKLTESRRAAEDSRRAKKRARREAKAKARASAAKKKSPSAAAEKIESSRPFPDDHPIYTHEPVVVIPAYNPLRDATMSHTFQGAPQAQMTSGPAVSHVRENGGMDFAIDPQLQESETAKQARLALESAEGGPLPAPPPGHAGSFPLGNPYMESSSNRPKKRSGGRKKKAAPVADLPEDRNDQRDASADLGPIEKHLNGQSEHPPEEQTNGTSEHAGAEEYAPALDEEAHEAAPDSQPARKRKRANGEGKAPKRAKKVAKRTDGATSREGSPAEEGAPQALPESGTFSKPELEMLDQFMERFCDEKNMTRKNLNALIHSKAKGNEEHINSFWDSVFDLLPQRKDRRSIRLTCRRRYHNYEERGKWSAEDDQALRDAYLAKPNKWATIGSEIGRMPEDCKDRWQNYVGCGDNRRTGDWSEKEEMQLTMAIEECKDATRTALMQEAKEAKKEFEERDDYISLISFKAVSEKMGYVRSGLQCRQHWKRMQRRDARLAFETQNPSKKKKTWRDVQAIDNWNRMKVGDKYQIISQVRDTDTQAEHNIPWKMITKENPESKWTTKDRKVAFEMCKGLVPAQPTLSDTVAELMQFFERNHPQELNDFYQGPVRAEETVSRPVRAKADDAANVDPSLEDDETAPQKRAKKASKPRSKGKSKADKHKSADVITASDDEPDQTASQGAPEEVEAIEQSTAVEDRIQDHLPGFEPRDERVQESSPQLPEGPEDLNDTGAASSPKTSKKGKKEKKDKAEKKERKGAKKEKKEKKERKPRAREAAGSKRARADEEISADVDMDEAAAHQSEPEPQVVEDTD